MNASSDTPYVTRNRAFKFVIKPDIKSRSLFVVGMTYSKGNKSETSVYNDN